MIGDMTKQTTKNSFSEHLFEYRYVEQKKLLLSLFITVITMVIELLGGVPHQQHGITQ